MINHIKQSKIIMNRVLSLFVFLLFFTASVSSEPLANQKKSGLYARSIEHVLQLNEKDIDLATAVLIISEQWNDNVYGRNYISKLDDMAYEIRDRLNNKNLPTNHKAIPIINKYLFGELGFRAVTEATNPDDLFLHSVLDNKRGYCLSLSILYLAIGERLGLPLYGVAVPGHFFVRYDDDKITFNIEATNNGMSASDQHYTDKFGVPSYETIYLRSLTKRQSLGCFFNNLGNVYSETGNTASAQLALVRAVEINPLLSESRTNLGNIYLNNGEIDEAIYQYRTALQINSNDAKTHNNLGNAYSKKEWWNEAVSQYSQALELDPDFTDVYANLASTYFQIEMYDEAISQLKYAIARKPKNAAFYNQLATIYSQIAEYEQAVSLYKKALKIKPDFARAYYGLGICYNKLGLSDEEIQAYKMALAYKPDMADVMINLGSAYFVRQKYDAAIEQYKKAARLTPGNAMIHYNLGAAHSNKEDYKQAVAAHQRAIEIDSQMANAHNALAFGFYKLKKYQLAWKHINRAEELGAEIAQDLWEAIKQNLL